MQLHNLSKTTKNRRRVGRGISAGGGKTAGRGTKGQKSRSGYKISTRFEGGQTHLFARLPKVKISVRSHTVPTIAFNLDQIDKLFNNGDKVTLKALIDKKIVKGGKKFNIKILSRGKLTKNIDLSECKLSAAAAKKISSKPKSKTNSKK